MLLAIPLTQAAVGAASQRLYVCVREMTAHDQRFDLCHSETGDPAPLAGGYCRPGLGLGRITSREGG
jgi:hypothetical protein